MSTHSEEMLQLLDAFKSLNPQRVDAVLHQIPLGERVRVINTSLPYIEPYMPVLQQMLRDGSGFPEWFFIGLIEHGYHDLALTMAGPGWFGPDRRNFFTKNRSRVTAYFLIDFADVDPTLALLGAIKRNDLEFFRETLDRYPEFDLDSALESAAMYDRLTMVQDLVTAGAEDLELALHTAVINDAVSVTKYLLPLVPSLNIQDLVYEAIERDAFKVLKKLLRRGGIVNEQAFETAIDYNQLSVLTYLLRKADPTPKQVGAIIEMSNSDQDATLASALIKYELATTEDFPEIQFEPEQT